MKKVVFLWAALAMSLIGYQISKSTGSIFSGSGSALANKMVSDSTGFTAQPMVSNPIIQDASRMNVLGERLWFAGAETGDLSEWSGNPIMNPNNVLFSGTTTERSRSGNRSFKLQADMGGKMASTQLYVWGPDGPPTQNPDAIYTAWFFIPEKIDMQGVSWYNIFQWKARITDNTSRKTSVTHIEVRGGKGSGGNNYLQLYWTDWSSGRARDNRIPAVNQVDIPIGRWFKVQARYWHSTGNSSNGRIMMWQDDVLIFDQGNLPTYPDRILGQRITELQWSVNNYGQNSIPAITTVYVDDASIHLPGNPESAPEPTYALTLQRNPAAGGTVQNLTGGNDFEEGKEIRLRATPNQGYAFLNWTRNGQVISNNREHTFTMPASNTTLIANFERLEETQTPSNPVNNTDSAALLSGLVAFYEMDANEGNQLRDSHGENHGVNSGVHIRDGFIQKGNHYNGNTSISAVPHHPSLNMNAELTMMADIYRTGTGQDNVSIILGKTNGQTLSVQDYSLGINAENRIRVRIHNGTFQQDWVSTQIIPANRWVRVIATYKSGEGYQLFINSLNAEKSSVISGNIVQSGKELTIGSATLEGNAAQQRRFHGILDNVGLWNRKLNEEEIKVLIERKITYPDFFDEKAYKINLSSYPINAGKVSIKFDQ
ncbi:MAG: LamG-like jellyroll fold domain-containing protein [Cecembia sp.]